MCYRIKVSENLRRHIEVADGIQSKLEILDIPPEQTAALLERELAAAGFEQDLQAKVTEEFEGKLGDLRRELDQVSNRVTVEALEQKAASMGEVQEVSEDAQTGSLTIRVKI